MKSKNNKPSSEEIHSRVYIQAAKVKGLAHLIEYQDVAFTFTDHQRDINIAVSMILEDLATEIHAISIEIEKRHFKKK